MSKRLEKILFIGAGGFLGLLSALVTHVAVAQPPADATYKTKKVCVVCHNVTNKELVAAFEKTAHPQALLPADKAGAIVASFGDDCPMEKSDIVTVIGVGKRSQAYVGKDGKVLPGKWLVKEKKWAPLQSVDAATQCLPCHVTAFDTAKKTYGEMGVQCEACHGPGSAHASSGDKTKTGQMSTLSPDKQAMVCAQCHSVGTSVKDPTLKHAVGYKWGDDIKTHLKLAEVTGPAMNQQYNEWLASTHATQNVGCTTCHEVHGPASANEAMLKKPGNELCMGCHATDVAKEGHPKVTEAIKCIMCHMPQGMHTFKMPK